jgi:hypothetical protein
MNSDYPTFPDRYDLKAEDLTLVAVWHDPPCEVPCPICENAVSPVLVIGSKSCRIEARYMEVPDHE